MSASVLNIPVYQGGSVSGSILLPGSKSLSNRLLLIAALSGKKVRLKNLLISDDTRYMTQALRSLGIKVNLFEMDQFADISSGGVPHRDSNLFVGNAGTAMRFLTTYLSLGIGNFEIDGDSRMHERPIRDLVEAILQIGETKINYLDHEGCPPLRIESNGLRGGHVKISGKNSSQYLSSLLMAAPHMKQGLDLEIIDELSSRPYFEMTLHLLDRFGISVWQESELRYHISPGNYQMPQEITVEPDASSATYFMILPLLFGGEISILGLGKNSLQGDVAFAEVLMQMGAKVEMRESEIYISSDGKFKGVDVDMNAIPDTVPTLAVLALFADGPTRIRNVENLRIKECDRLKALSTEIQKIGGKIKETFTGLEIFPEPRYTNGLIETYKDHRIAMSFFLAGLKINGLSLENPSCVGKSFPNYYRYMGDFLNICDFWV